MRLIILIILSALTHCGLSQGTVQFLPIADGLLRPTGIVNAGNQADKMFLIVKNGEVKILNIRDFSISSTLFLDIKDRVDDSGFEKGLLGIAFHPDYGNNGYFYVNYTFDAGNNIDETRISRFSVTSDPSVADPNSELVLLSYVQPESNHNAGDLHFGSDGYLYIASGDGGGSGDPSNYGQNTNYLLGAILRIDVDNTSGAMNYSIPAGNPFNSEIWLYGLRNPWRFSFDPATQDMYIADVGQSSREEVSVVPANTGGLNLGWKCREGFISFSGCSGTFHDPIFDYPRSKGASITGGHVYRGNSFPNFTGWYFFIDYVTENLWQTKGTSANGLQIKETNIGNVNGISSFGVSESGELYAVSFLNGIVYRIIDSSDCPTVLTLNNDTNPIEKAQLSISSSAILNTNNPVEYGAQEIQLTQGFQVPSNTAFMTQSGICGSY